MEWAFAAMMMTRSEREAAAVVRRPVPEPEPRFFRRGRLELVREPCSCEA